MPSILRVTAPESVVQRVWSAGVVDAFGNKTDVYTDQTVQDVIVVSATGDLDKNRAEATTKLVAFLPASASVGLHDRFTVRSEAYFQAAPPRRLINPLTGSDRGWQVWLSDVR